MASRPARGSRSAVASEQAVRAGGGVPATIGVLDGEIVVGLTEEELHRFDASARKLGPRDLAAAVVQRVVGATTVGGTLAVCRAAGIRVMATGGLGGVHRGWPDRRRMSQPTSARSHARRRSSSLSGVKSLLDVPATAELLETLGVPVLGCGTDDAAALLHRGGRPFGLGARRDGGGGCAHRPRALGARRRWAPRSDARPTRASTTSSR